MATVALCLLGIACIGYGVSVMMIKSGTLFFAVWYALGAVFLAAALATHVGWLTLLPLVARRFGVAVLVLLVAAFGVTQGFILFGFGAKGEDGLDCIIVLGAQVRPDESPSAVLQHRLDAAVAYLQANPRTRCIVSGGQGSNEPCTEADCMADYLVKQGIEPNRVVRERSSRDTMQNIRNSMAFLNPATERVGIVTNDFHVFRSTRIAAKAGIRHVCGIAAYSTPWYLPNNMLRESMGLAKDALAGNL